MIHLFGYAFTDGTGGDRPVSIEIVENPDLGCLEVTYTADPVTPQDLAVQRSSVTDAVSRSGIRKVLLDASSLPNIPSLLTVLRHNESVSQDEDLRRTKFAVVCSSLGPKERRLETTGVNRGVNMRCFTSREDALSWLIQ